MAAGGDTTAECAGILSARTAPHTVRIHARPLLPPPPPNVDVRVVAGRLVVNNRDECEILCCVQCCYGQVIYVTEEVGDSLESMQEMSGARGAPPPAANRRPS